eukprot:767328-Hanusia_phi.AAC.3
MPGVPLHAFQKYTGMEVLEFHTFFADVMVYFLRQNIVRAMPNTPVTVEQVDSCSKLSLDDIVSYLSAGMHSLVLDKRFAKGEKRGSSTSEFR